MDGTKMLLIAVVGGCIVGSIYLFARLIMGIIESHEERIKELINHHGEYAESYTRAAVAEAMMQVRKEMECDQDECAGRMQTRVDSMIEKRLEGIIEKLNQKQQATTEALTKRIEEMERNIALMRHEVSLLASQLGMRHRQ